METQVHGGNIFKTIDISQSGKQNFASGPYEYFFYRVTESETRIVFDELNAFTVYVLESQEGQLALEDGTRIAQGASIQIEGISLVLTNQGGKASLLVSGTKEASQRVAGITVTDAANIYKVDKPWGHELWLNGEHPQYCLKQVYLRGGNRTSLQYHRLKQETNVLFSGDAKIHYKKNPDVSNDDVTPEDVSSRAINPVTSVDVHPNTLHRVESVSDIFLYETSTPHLDDVVRVQDDTNRENGRITSEHQGA